MTDKAQTARDAIANCLLMGRGMYPSPEEWADAVLKRLAHDGFVVVPIGQSDVVKAAKRFDACMSEFEGDLSRCHEDMDMLFTAVGKLREEGGAENHG